jgi:hypothetical protein
MLRLVANEGILEAGRGFLALNGELMLCVDVSARRPSPRLRAADAYNICGLGLTSPESAVYEGGRSFFSLRIWR